MKVDISKKSQDLIIKVALIAIIYFILAKPILNYLGITKSKSDRLKSKIAGNPESPFGVNFFKKYVTKTSTARHKQLTAHAHNIKNAMGFWTDDEQAVISAFKDLKTQVEVSIMSYIFTQRTGADLFSHLTDGRGYMPQNGLSDYDMQILINYVASLPEK